ncbi:MAG: DUF3885 domain-containing protein [Myxococcales bacterium]|nr:DUF3885 domain-containing protein [Myxococcales bacterium]
MGLCSWDAWRHSFPNQLDFCQGGMDVVASKRETLLPLFHEHRARLLDYDRERMEKIFL